MAIQILIDGQIHDVPPEDDWELGELGELEKLRVEYGDALGSLIGTAWMIKHRTDPKFSIDDAKHIKLGQIGNVEGDDESDPLDRSPTLVSESSSNGGEHSSTLADGASGLPSSSRSTDSVLGT